MEKISPECVATVNETCAEDMEQSLAEDVGKVSATEERSETLLGCDFIVEDDSTRLLWSLRMCVPQSRGTTGCD